MGMEPAQTPARTRSHSQPALRPMHRHQKVTGLSGNEIFCLKQIHMRPGNLCVGNSVYSMGVVGSLGATFNVLTGGEVPQVTELVHDGRAKALERMKKEARHSGGGGITGVTTELIRHAGNIEFLSIGSLIHREDRADELIAFSSSSDAQELYCQVDAGFTPVEFVFGNIAYSIGLGGNLGGFVRSLTRGEVPQFTEIFDTTRHLALTRICNEARRVKANAVVGINTAITPFMGAQEMLMIGTAANHPALVGYDKGPITSDMTNEEMWNMIHIGYMPVRLVMGVSVYALGIAGGIKSMFQSLVRGEINTLSSLLYEAREKALERIQEDANRYDADEVVGVKTHVYDLGGGLVEFLAIGTAVKKMEVTTRSPTLIAQAVVRDRDTYFEGGQSNMDLGSAGKSNARAAQAGPLVVIMVVLMLLGYAAFAVFLKRMP